MGQSRTQFVSSFAAESCGEINKVKHFNQGMVFRRAQNITANLPISVLKSSWTICILSVPNNPIKAKQTTELRGTYEVQAIQKSISIKGRTDWEQSLYNGD